MGSRKGPRKVERNHIQCFVSKRLSRYGPGGLELVMGSRSPMLGPGPSLLPRVSGTARLASVPLSSVIVQILSFPP